MAEPFLGELRIFTFPFPPKGWAFCNGQLLAIAQNQALFSLLGTSYGGNGVSTFALPDLQGKVPIHFGQGSGSGYVLGETGGLTAVTLTNNQTGHTHSLAANTAGSTNSPANNFPAAASGVTNFAAATDGTTLAGSELPNFGGSQSHNNMQPYLTINVCIALQGIFPSRN